MALSQVNIVKPFITKYDNNIVKILSLSSYAKKEPVDLNVYIVDNEGNTLTDNEGNLLTFN